MDEVYSLFGQSAPVFDHPQAKEVFKIRFKWNFLYSICIRCLSSCHWALMREVWLCLLSTLPSGTQCETEMLLSILLFRRGKDLVLKLVQPLIIRYHPTHTSCLVLYKIRLAFLRFRNYVCIYELYRILPTL